MPRIAENGVRREQPHTGASRAARGAAHRSRIRESGPTRNTRPAAPRTSTDTVVPSAPNGRRNATTTATQRRRAPDASSGIVLPGAPAWCLPAAPSTAGMREAALAGTHAPTSEARIPKAIPCPRTEALNAVWPDAATPKSCSVVVPIMVRNDRDAATPRRSRGFPRPPRSPSPPGGTGPAPGEAWRRGNEGFRCRADGG